MIAHSSYVLPRTKIISRRPGTKTVVPITQSPDPHITIAKFYIPSRNVSNFTHIYTRIYTVFCEEATSVLLCFTTGVTVAKGLRQRGDKGFLFLLPCDQ